MLFGWADAAYAQDGLVAAPIDFTNTLTAFQTAAAMWNPALKSVASTTFWSLAFIEFAWMSMALAIKGADLSDIAWEMIKMIMFLGFFWELVLAGPAWSNAVIQSFQQAGDLAVSASGGTSSMNPSAILAEGLKTALTIMNTPGVWNPITALGLEIGALIILICFAYIAAYYAVTLIESYIVIGASILFYAFGGSRWTVDTARRVFMYSVSVGAKLFILELIAGTTYVLMQSWVAAYQNNNSSMFGLIALALTVAIVTAMLPGIVQSVVSGASTAGSSEAMSIGRMAMGATVGAATAGLGAIAATSAAHSLAKVQSAAGAASRTGTGGADSQTGGGESPASVNPMVGGMPGSGAGGSIEPARNLGGPISGRSVSGRSTSSPSPASRIPGGDVSGTGASIGGGNAPTTADLPASSVAEAPARYAAAEGQLPSASASDSPAAEAEPTPTTDIEGAATNDSADPSAAEAQGATASIGDSPAGAANSEGSAPPGPNPDRPAPESPESAPATSAPPSYAKALARNLVTAAGKEIMAHLSGQRRYTQARHSGFRMAEGMKDQAAQLQKPTPPTIPSSGSTAPPDAPRPYPPNVDQPDSDSTTEKSDAG